MCDNHTHEHEHAHTHEHEHIHTHEHEHNHGGEAEHTHVHEDLHAHEHGHDHTHADGHGHAHGEAHTHSHDGAQAAQSADENLALLRYMLDHNRHHGEDLHELFHALEAAGNKEAAAAVSEALHLYDHGNAKLAEALKLLGGE